MERQGLSWVLEELWFPRDLKARVERLSFDYILSVPGCKSLVLSELFKRELTNLLQQANTYRKGGREGSEVDVHRYHARTQCGAHVGHFWISKIKGWRHTRGQFWAI